MFIVLRCLWTIHLYNTGIYLYNACLIEVYFIVERNENITKTSVAAFSEAKLWRLHYFRTGRCVGPAGRPSVDRAPHAASRYILYKLCRYLHVVVNARYRKLMSEIVEPVSTTSR